MRNIFSTLFILVLFVTVNNAQQAYFMTEDNGQFYPLTQRLEKHSVNGAAQVVVRNFQIDTTIYLGYANKENSVLVNENTIFQMGSMTTPVTKFAVMKLVSAGKIDLDAPANNYLKNWQIPSKKFTKEKPVTVRDLLLKSRGFNDVYKPKGYTTNDDLPTWEQIMAGEQPSNLPALQLKKDKSGDNSSIAPDLILQRLLEDVHGKSFVEIIETEVFQPLEMTRSIITTELTKIQKENAAIGYYENGERVAGGANLYPELAVAGLWSTPVDYAKFVLHVFQAVNGTDNRFLSQALAQQSVTAQRDYFSLIFNKNDNVYWGGAPKGFYSQFAGNAEEGWIVVSCTNRELAWQLVNWDLNPRGMEYAKRTE